jgi:hypothetical protein
MAAKKQDLPPISTAQKAEARDLFVIGLLDTKEIAERLGVSSKSVRMAATADHWMVRRRRYGSQEEVQARRKAHMEKMAAARETVESICADVAIERLEAQLKVAKALHDLANLPVPHVLTNKDDGQGLASALGPASQDVTAGRLAVGLHTDKVSVDDARADEFRAKFFNLLSAECAVAPVATPPGSAAGVEQGDGENPKPVAGKA